MTGALVLLAVLSLSPPAPLGPVAQAQQPAAPVPTPASVVAGHVRSALSNPDEVMNWALLEASVQDFEGTSSGTDASLWGNTLDPVRYWASELVQAAGTEVAIALGLMIVLVLIGRTISRQLRLRRSRNAPPAKASVDISSGRAWTATVLSDQGLSSLEIARRTGMARDAVSLALHTHTVPAGVDHRYVA